MATIKRRQEIKFKRPKRNDPHQTHRWHQYSKSYLKNNRLCKICKDKGIVELAECVDHVIPYPIHPDFWDSDNHQPLSLKCHSIKTKEDRKKYKLG